MASAFSDPRFHNEEAAFAHLEGIIWPGGKPASCPCCGVVGKANKLAVQTSKASKKNPEGKPVYGVWKCYACRQKFTVRKGTIFEESRLELHLWMQAAYLMCSSKKGVSANQIHRTLGVTLKTAWFLAHRLREAMAANGPQSPFGSFGGIVVADETFIGRIPGRKLNRGPGHKMKVLTLIDRDTKQARSTVISDLTPATIGKVLLANTAREAHLQTDEAGHYKPLAHHFESHKTVNHSEEEYVRGDVTTNHAEGFFSVFKRGMKGVYQHCQEQHLHRYLAEVDFRYNNRIANGVNDAARADLAIRGAKGKRLRYKQDI